MPHLVVIIPADISTLSRRPRGTGKNYVAQKHLVLHQQMNCFLTVAVKLVGHDRLRLTICTRQLTELERSLERSEERAESKTKYIDIFPQYNKNPK